MKDSSSIHLPRGSSLNDNTRSKRRNDLNSRRRISDGRRWRRQSSSSLAIIASSVSLMCITSMFHPTATHALPIDIARILQSGISIGTSVVDTNSCYTHLSTSDINQDSKLSPSEFVTFIQLSADGALDTNEYGMPITMFAQLPEEFIRIYNFLACGGADIVCPSVVGINIMGAKEGEESSLQQDVTLFQLCKVVQLAVGKLPSGAPTSSPVMDGMIGSDVPTTTPNAPSSLPTKSPLAPGVTNVPITTQPTPQLPPCPPLYNSGDYYEAGDALANNGGEENNLYFIYQCKPSPEGDFCKLPEYEPGNSESSWEKAWTLVGQCVVGGADVSTLSPTMKPTFVTQPSYPPTTFDGVSSPPTVKPVEPVPEGTPTTKPTFGTQPTYPPTVTVGTTESPTSKPSPAAVPPPPTSSPISIGAAPTTLKPTSVQNVDPNDPPYSGPLTTSFEYEIFNTDDMNADSIMADASYMQVLTVSTAGFVEGVVETTFGTTPSGEDGVDHNKGNDAEASSGGGGVRFVDISNGKRHRVHGGYISQGGQRHRSLEVLLGPNSVTISNVQDVSCSDPSLNTPCQKISADTEMTLVNEPKQATELAFQSSISKALQDPGITFPEDSVISYAGPFQSSSVETVVTPVISPGELPLVPPEKEEESGTPGWVVPVSIGAAAVGAILLLLLVGNRVQKRKRSGIEYQGTEAAIKPREFDLGGDLAAAIPGGAEGVAESGLRESYGSYGSGGSGSYDAEIRYGSPQDNKVSPLDSQFDDLESGLQQDIQKDRGMMGGTAPTNPFLDDSNSDSIPSGSYSSSGSSSSSSSTEDLNTDPKEFWKRKEQEQQQANKLGQQQPGHPQQSQAPPARDGSLAAAQSNSEYLQLQTLFEVSEENMSTSEWSLRSGASESDKSDKSVYRAGVEALVKEACPDKIDKIDEMMVEYEGREEVLIGHLSTMLAAKNRDMSGSASDTEDDDEPDANMRYASLSTDYTTSTSDYTTSGYSSSGTSAYLSSGTETNSTVSARSTLDTLESPSPPKDAAAAVASKEGNSSSSDDEYPSTPDRVVGAPAAAAAALFAARPNKDENIDSSASSSADSTGWSSDDGFSSIDASSFTTDTTNETDGQELDVTADATAAFAAIGDASAVSARVSGYHGSSKPTFIPVDGPNDDGGGSPCNHPTREDLDDAIQAGDWKAVGATAALIANPTSKKVSPTNKDSNNNSNNNSEDFNSSDFNSSRFSISTQEKDQVEELESLVEAGNWEAVMAAASRIDTGSESGSLSEGPEDFLNKAAPPPSLEVTSPDSDTDRAGMRMAIEELVKAVVPEEIGNLDEMLIQFRGREEELLATLNTMRRQSNDNSSEDGSALHSLGASSHRQDSLSVYENDINGDASHSTGGPRRSSFSTGASSSYYSSTSGEGDIGDVDSTTEDEEEFSCYNDTICSTCAKHLPRSEYSDDQWAKGNGASKCIECAEMSY